MDGNWLNTMRAYDAYERRFAQARLEKTDEYPRDEAAHMKTVERVKRMLAYEDALVPEIHNVEEVSRFAYDTYDVIQYRYESWENCFGCASMYLPHGEGKVPLVLLFCGHGAEGRHTEKWRNGWYQPALRCSCRTISVRVTGRKWGILSV